MGCTQSRVYASVYRVGMDAETFFDTSIYAGLRLMCFSLNSEQTHRIRCAPAC
jgi:hypothetical protein